MSILLDAILGKPIKQKDIVEELYKMCDREYACCNSECLVYKLNGNKIPNFEKGEYSCDCFKSPNKMLKFIRNKLSEE